MKINWRNFSGSLLARSVYLITIPIVLIQIIGIIIFFELHWDLVLKRSAQSISNEIIYNLNKVLENYQINITKYVDGNYIKSFFNNEIEISKMTFDILNGCNENEVMVVQKNTKKLGFFEKFFQLFS